MIAARVDPSPLFDHPGLLYRGADEYTRGVGGFVRAAVTSGDAVLVAVPTVRLELLRAELAGLGDAVTFADMTVDGRNPGRIIPGVLLAFAGAHPGRRVSMVGEPIWAGRTEVEYPACAAHEALINAVFAGHDASILCPYDADALDRGWLHDAWRTHPVMIAGATRRPSPWYTGPFDAAALFNRPLPDPSRAAPAMSFADAAELDAVRRFVARHAAGLRLSPDRVDDLVVAVNELAENTIVHTEAAGVVTLWSEPGYVVCQVTDGGYLADPLAGRVPPPGHAVGGRGLLLANLLCDLVRIHAHPGGTSVRLHMSRFR